LALVVAAGALSFNVLGGDVRAQDGEEVPPADIQCSGCTASLTADYIEFYAMPHPGGFCQPRLNFTKGDGSCVPAVTTCVPFNWCSWSAFMICNGECVTFVMTVFDTLGNTMDLPCGMTTPLDDVPCGFTDPRMFLLTDVTNGAWQARFNTMTCAGCATATVPPDDTEG
jgi:hypothetical protein